MATIEEIRAKVRNATSSVTADAVTPSPQGEGSAIEQVRQQVLAGASSDQSMNAATAAGRQYAEAMAREQEAARERAALEQRQAESIAAVDSVNPYTVQKLGAAPLASNVQPTDRQTEPGMYAAALNQLQSARQAQRETPAISETLRATKAAQLGLPETRTKATSSGAVAPPSPQGEGSGVQQVSGQPRSDLDRLIDETEKLQDIVDRYERSGIYDEKYQLAKDFLDQYRSEITMSKSGAGTKASTARQDRARERTQQLLAMDTEAERRKQSGSDAMRDQMDELRGILDRYDQAGVKDAKYDLIKWNLEEQEKEYQRQFGDMADVRDIDEAEKLQRLRELESVQGAQDFWGRSQYDPAYGSSSEWNALRNQYDVEGDLLYDYVNDKNGVRTKATVNALEGEHGGLDLEYLKQMTADEKRVYNYLYATEGKDAAEEYLELLSSDLNARNMDEVSTWWKGYAAEHPAIASAASVAMSPARGAAYIGQIADYLDDGSIDPNASYNRYTRIPSAIREQVSNEVAGKWGQVGSFLYETGMSMADFLTNAAITGGFTGGGAVEEALTLGIMGTGAAADATIAGLERGLTNEQALALGTIAGVAEVLTEKVSLETLLDKTALEKSLIGYLFKNTLAEGSEEVGSDFINLFADVLIAKDKSEWAESVQHYKDLGQDDSRAFWSAFADQARTMGVDFLGGAISGLLMAGGSVSIDQAAAKIQQNRVDQLRQTLSDLAESQERTEQERDRLLKQAIELEEGGADPMRTLDDTGWARAENGNWYMPSVGYEETVRTPEGERIESETEGDTSSVTAAAATPSPQGEGFEGADFITEQIRKVDPDFDELTDEQQREYRTYQEQALREAQAMTEAGTDPAMVYAQTGWTQDAAGNWTKTMEETAEAEAPAQSAAEGEENNEVLLYDGSERTDGTGAGGQAGRLAEGTGGTADAGGTGGAEIAARINAASTSEAKSSRDFGVTDGLEVKDIREIPANTDAELQGLSELGSAMGVPVRFVDRRMQVRNRRTGKIQNVEAVYTDQGIVVCATLRGKSATALTMHEMYHAIQGANEQITAQVWRQLEKQYGKEQMDELLKKTVETYQGIYGTADEDLHYYQEEVIADLYGGLDRRGMGYTAEMQQTVQQLADNPAWMTPGEARESGSRSGGQRYMAGGENARTADLAARDEAVQMLESGADPAWVYAYTGWYRGPDGRMRFEIDDSRMDYSSRGDARYGRENPNYTRYRELTRKAESAMLYDTEDLTADESIELERLRNQYGSTERRLSARVNYGETRLQDLISHDALFEAYPELRDVGVDFSDMASNDLGNYSMLTKTITLNSKLRNAPEATLLHEIQHAIQDIEGFAQGSNTEYWRIRKKQGTAPLTQEERARYAQYRADLERYEQENPELVREARAWAEMPQGMDATDAENFLASQTQDELMEKFGEDEFAEVASRVIALKDARTNRTDYELYRDTAGEQEARNTAERRDMTAGERRASMPKPWNEDTVFVEDESPVRFSLAEDEDNISSVTADAVTPSPQGEGMAETGEAEAAAETTESAEETARAKVRAQAEAMTRPQLEQRLKTDQKQQEQYDYLRESGQMTPALERKAAAHAEHMAIRQQVLSGKTFGNPRNVRDQVDLALRVDSKQGLLDLRRQLEQQRGALNQLKKTAETKKQLKELSDGIERIKKELSNRNRAERARKREQKRQTAEQVRAVEARTTLRQELMQAFNTLPEYRNDVANTIDAIAREIEQKGRIDREIRNRLFNHLLNRGGVQVIENDYANDIRREMQGTRIYVPEDVRAEWKGDFDAFRRRAWGSRLYLTSDPADGGWDVHNLELAEAYPGSFDADETDAKVALENMLNVMEEGKASGMTLKDWLTTEAGGSQEGMVSAQNAMLQTLEAALNRFAGAARVEIDTKARSIMQEADEALQMEERADRIRQDRSLRELQTRVISEAKTLQRLEKKTDNATREQIRSVIGDIDLMARSISPEGLENLQALAAAYQEQKDAEGVNFIPNDYVEKRLARLGQRHVADMDASELQELANVISGMVTSIRANREMIGDQRGRMIADEAAAWDAEIRGSRGMKQNLLTKWLQVDQVRPTTFLQMISGWHRGGTGEQLAKMLEAGELKQLDFLMRGTKHFEAFLNEPEVQKWLKTASGKNAEAIRITGLNGMDAEGRGKVDSFTISPMMRVSLYMDAQNNDNLRHIKEGGVRIPDWDLYKQGKTSAAYSAGQLVLLQPEDVEKILGGSRAGGDLGANMSQMELRFARLLAQYMDGMSKEAINATSMELDGIERAMEAHYWPIRTDKNFLAKQPDAVKYDSSLENIGNIKNERQHATNPIMLYDATEMLAWHMELTARYASMAVPMRNLLSVYNYNFPGEAGGVKYPGSIKQTIDQKWHADALNYLEQLMADVQNGQTGEQSTIGQISAKLRGMLAGSTLALNPRVALGQLASYPAALQSFDVRSMLQGLNLAERVDEKLIEQYSPVLWYRSQGNITDEINKEGLQLPKWLDLIGFFDKAAIKRIWAASEAWVENNTDLRRPTGDDPEAADLFYRKVAEKFNRAVFDTQPNYTTLQRTQLQRSGSELTKLLAMYKTVPLQYYNMALEATTRLQETKARATAEGATEADQTEYKEAQQFAARTHVGIFAAQVVYVLARALVAKYGLHREQQPEDLAWQMAEAYAGSLICADTLLDLVKHWVTKSKAYDLEVSTLSTLNDLKDELAKAGDYLIKLVNGKAELDEGLDMIHEAAALGSRMIGLPIENVEKYVLGLMKWAAPEWAYRYENVFDQMEKTDVKDPDNLRDLQAKIEVMMDNRTDDLQDETIAELARLWSEGCGNALPTAVPNKFTVDGEDVYLSAKQRGAFKDAWSEAVTENLQALMDTDAYQEADDQGRQKMIAKLYDYGYEKGKAAAVNYEPDKWIREADESGMDLADYISQLWLIDSFEKTEEDSAKDLARRNLMAQDMDEDLRAKTYRSLIASEKEQAALEGMSDETLQEAVRLLNEIKETAKTDEQTAAEINRNLILTAKLTDSEKAQIYYNVTADKDGREWIDERVAAGDSVEDVTEALMKFLNADTTVDKLDVIRNSGLNEENKLALYHKITKDQDDRIEAFSQAGLNLDRYLEIAQKYSEINKKDLTASEKSTQFANWLDNNNYTSSQKAAVKQEMNYYSMVKADAGKYDALTESGLSADKALKVTEAIGALEPEDGKQQVSDNQKLAAIGQSGLPQKEQLAAAKVYADDSTDQKLDVLSGYDVTVAQYAEFRRLYSEYQALHKGENKGNQTAAKEAAMAVIGSNAATPGGSAAAAALWQTADKSWKAAGNPFDEAVGERVYAELNG